MYSSEFWDRIYDQSEANIPWIISPAPEEILYTFAGYLTTNSILLDYGCGNGRYATFFYKRVKEVIGAEISPKAIKLCQKYSKLSHIYFAQVPSDVPVKKIDAVLCWGVIHHINPDKRDLFFNDFKKMLKKGGYILISGWSEYDPEFVDGIRISKFTNVETWNIEVDIKKYLIKYRLTILREGIYEYIEQPFNCRRLIKYYLLKNE